MKFKPCRPPQNSLFRPDKQWKRYQTQFSDFLVPQQGQTSVCRNRKWLFDHIILIPTPVPARQPCYQRFKLGTSEEYEKIAVTCGHSLNRIWKMYSLSLLPLFRLFVTALSLLCQSSWFFFRVLLWDRQPPAADLLQQLGSVCGVCEWWLQLILGKASSLAFPVHIFLRKHPFVSYNYIWILFQRATYVEIMFHHLRPNQWLWTTIIDLKYKYCLIIH